MSIPINLDLTVNQWRVTILGLLTIYEKLKKVDPDIAKTALDTATVLIVKHADTEVTTPDIKDMIKVAMEKTDDNDQSPAKGSKARVR